MKNRLNFPFNHAYSKISDKIFNLLNDYNNFRNYNQIKEGKARIHLGNNLHKLRSIDDDKIDAIITSPPYLDLIDYIEEDRFQLNYLFNRLEILHLKKNSIGNRQLDKKNTYKKYWKKMAEVLKETHRVLKSNGVLIFVIGNYGNMRNSYEYIFKEIGFKVTKILRREIVNKKKKDNSEYVFFLSK